MSKLDLTKLFKDCYTSRSEPGIVDVPPGSFLTIAGRGAPGGDAYQQKLEALYAVAYLVVRRFARRSCSTARAVELEDDDPPA